MNPQYILDVAAAIRFLRSKLCRTRLLVVYILERTSALIR
jgi:hypothetical protein